MPQISEWGYGILAASLVVAVLVDGLIFRTVLELLRPASRWTFLAARVGKLASLGFWLYFIQSFWYPQYAADGGRAAEALKISTMAILGGAALVALVSHPRMPRPKDGSHV